MKKIVLFFAVLFVSSLTITSFSQIISESEIILPNQNNVNWWMGIINHGEEMPVKNDYQADLYADVYGNQAQPLLLSDKGSYIWSEDPFSVHYINDSLIVRSEFRSLEMVRAGDNLRDSYLAASNSHFPPSGKLPDMLLVERPQYNTWIELMYDQKQEDILKYARSIVESGFPTGVLMIDDNWQEDYGNWEFHPGRFQNPKMMIDSLHSMGFKVMLWVCPFVSPDSYIYRDISRKGYLLKNDSNKPAMVSWWNGYSGLLDLTNPDAFSWFNEQLENLVKKYGVDGFKLDAGDADFYTHLKAFKEATPNEHCRLYGEIGLNYPLNEYRAMWKMGGQPLVQRLRDKGHNWEDLQKIIPDMCLSGLMGYPFSCPDMIGGGEFHSFLNTKSIDQELVVRSAQIHALMPMMQFSVSPWRILDKIHLEAIEEAVKIRERFIPEITRLTREAAISGEPVVRSMEYVFPHEGYGNINDQFMLGDSILIAPIVEKNATSRQVLLPKGKWYDQKDKSYRGSKSYTIQAELNEIPVFVKK